METNEKQETEEKAGKQVLLEEFPAWQRARELNRLVSEVKSKEDRDSYRGARDTLQYSAESLIQIIAGMFVKTRKISEASKQVITEELARFKTALYLRYDRGQVERDQFTAILQGLARVGLEVEKFAETQRAKYKEELKKETPFDSDTVEGEPSLAAKKIVSRRKNNGKNNA